MIAQAELCDNVYSEDERQMYMREMSNLYLTLAKARFS